MPAGDAWINDAAAGRQYFREYRRANRSTPSSDARVGSRHKLFPCCGRRRSQCKCDFSVIKKHVKMGEWQKFRKRLQNVRLLRALDTSDTGVFLASVDGRPKGDLARFWFVCLAYRRFNNPETWQDIRHAAIKSPPDWKALGDALRAREAKGEKLFGLAFYPATLGRYRRNLRSPWRSCMGMATVPREVITLQLLHAAIPADTLRALGQDPSREGFALFYDEFMSNVAATTRKVFSEYSMKCALDLFVCSRAVPEHCLSRWPCCPGYARTMARLFPNLDKDDWLKAFYWMEREMAAFHGGKLMLPDILMHLCWDQRRASGRLQDESPPSGGVSPHTGGVSPGSVGRPKRSDVVPLRRRRVPASPKASPSLRVSAGAARVASPLGVRSGAPSVKGHRLKRRAK